MLSIAVGQRRFSELSMPNFAAWGAAGGLMLIFFPVFLVGVGLASIHGPAVNFWKELALLGVPMSALCALSACGTLLLGRMSERRQVSEPEKVS